MAHERFRELGAHTVNKLIGLAIATTILVLPQAISSENPASYANPKDMRLLSEGKTVPVSRATPTPDVKINLAPFDPRLRH